MISIDSYLASSTVKIIIVNKHSSDATHICEYRPMSTNIRTLNVGEFRFAFLLYVSKKKTIRCSRTLFVVNAISIGNVTFQGRCCVTFRHFTIRPFISIRNFFSEFSLLPNCIVKTIEQMHLWTLVAVNGKFRHKWLMHNFCDSHRRESISCAVRVYYQHTGACSIDENVWPWEDKDRVFIVFRFLLIRIHM